jgi:hypothetical protein
VGYFVGVALFTGGWSTLWWVIRSGRRERSRLVGRIVVLPPPSRYDEHLMRTEITKIFRR